MCMFYHGLYVHRAGGIDSHMAVISFIMHVSVFINPVSVLRLGFVLGMYR